MAEDDFRSTGRTTDSFGAAVSGGQRTSHSEAAPASYGLS